MSKVCLLQVNSNKEKGFKPNLDGGVAGDRGVGGLVKDHALDAGVNVLHVGQQGLAVFAPVGRQLQGHNITILTIEQKMTLLLTVY